MICACNGHELLLRVPTKMVPQWSLLEVFWLLINTNVDLVPALVAIVRVVEEDWAVSEAQKRLPYI